MGYLASRKGEFNFLSAEGNSEQQGWRGISCYFLVGFLVVFFAEDFLVVLLVVFFAGLLVVPFAELLAKRPERAGFLLSISSAISFVME